MKIEPEIEIVAGIGALTVIVNCLSEVTDAEVVVALIVNVEVVFELTASKVPEIAPVEVFKDKLEGKLPL